MHGHFRRDLVLAPGAAFRLQRRAGARALSGLLAVAAVAWGLFDLWAGYRLAGAATLVLAVAFVAQLVYAELDSWRLDGDAAVWRTVSLRPPRVREERLSARQISAVHVAAASGRARAWLELREGSEYALVEGREDEVRRIAERLDGALQLAALEARHLLH